jgi:hypothetical protein
VVFWSDAEDLWAGGRRPARGGRLQRRARERRLDAARSDVGQSITERAFSPAATTTATTTGAR